ncbi:hypothetical protein KCP69_26590 (plasmid) [Salmonella enterica subsp. enterica]|nr:hypothetical protein KCP69_26590 [Salmonella enterica subsp. enterica]
MARQWSRTEISGLSDSLARSMSNVRAIRRHQPCPQPFRMVNSPGLRTIDTPKGTHRLGRAKYR